MELAVFEDGIQKHKELIEHSIQSDGLFVCHESGYSYTTGMSQLNFPELIIENESKDAAEEIFQVIHQAVRMGLLNNISNGTIDRIFDPKVRVVEVLEEEKRQIFFAARNYYGNWGFDACKLQSSAFLVQKH